jgi:hypothetical protein
MVGIALLVVAVVLCLAYIVEPLVTKNAKVPWDRFGRDGSHSTEKSDQPTGRPVDSSEQRAMTDGGRVCHNCGSYVEGDYLYCAECLMPRV